MELHEAVDQRQTDPQPPGGVGQRLVTLDEELEDAREHVFGDADAGVAHPQGDLFVLLSDDHADAPAGRRVLGRVVDQIHDDLLEPGRVGLHV